MLDSKKKPTSLVVTFVNKTLLASPFNEPNTYVWDVVVSLIKKYVWNSLCALSVTCLLYDADRKKEKYCDTTRSRITLLVFLDLIKFALKLNMVKESSVFAENCIGQCITDLNQSDNASLPDAVVKMAINKIESNIDQFVWNAAIVESCLEVLKADTPRLSLESLLNQGVFFSTMHSKQNSDLTQDCVMNFVT